MNIIAKIKTKYVWAIFVAAFLFCTASLVARHLSLRTTALDTGAEAGVARNAAFNGSYACDVMDMNCLADHFSPALYLPGLLFYIWDNVGIILIFQNLCVFVSILLAFTLAKKILKDKYSALLMAIVYATNYYLNNVNNGEYHIETLALPLFLGLFILLERDRTALNTVFIAIISFVMLSIKEDLPLVLGIFGMWAVIFKKGKRIESIIICLIGLVGYFAITAIIMPHFAGGVLTHAGRYSTLGATTGEMLTTALTQPGKLFSALFASPDKIIHIVHLFASFLFLPLAAPIVIPVTFAPILIHSLSSYRPQYLFSSQYSLPAIPFLYYSTIYGWQKLANIASKGKIMKGKISINGLMAAVLFFAVFGGIVSGIRYSANFNKFNYDDYRSFHKNIKPLIPLNSRLLSPNHIQPQMFDVRYSGLLRNPQSLEVHPDYLILTKNRVPAYWQKEPYLEFVEKQKSSCQIIFEDDKYLVLKTGMLPDTLTN